MRHIEEKAKKLIAEHLDSSWSFKWNKRKGAMGVCSYRDKTIQLSKPLSQIVSESEVVDTILHEIAHALAGFKAGHGPKWKQVAKSIGANPERCKDLTQEERSKINYKYTATCPKCGESHGFSRMTPRRGRSACGACCRKYNGNKFSPEYIRKITQNY